MLKVVIADDEIRVCRLVQKLVDWDALEMELIGTASNGIEALEAIETLKPDILITDIRMPGCDGLELIEKAKRLSPILEIIIISGYAQFEYAQIAIGHGISAYLLKPINRDGLMSALKKIKEKCAERSASAMTIERLWQDSVKSKGLLRNRLIEDLLYKRLDEVSAEQLSNDYGFRIKSDGISQVFILKMDYEREALYSLSLESIQKKIEEIFIPPILQGCITGIFQFYGSAGYGLLHFERDKDAEIRRLLRSSLNQLETQRFILGNVEFSLSVGKTANITEEIPISMHMAQNAICERIVEGTGRLLEFAQGTSEGIIQHVLDKYNRAIDVAVDLLNINDANKAADEIEHAAGEISNVRGYELLELLLSAGRMFAARINAKDDDVYLKDFYDCCQLCNSVQQLFECLRDFQKKQIEITLQQREKEENRPIRIAKNYIREHYKEPITLEDVCAATGFSVSYFSTMFKKETGEGFSKYITRVRIEHAKALLQETNMPITEICEQVGYNDIKHFVSTFKKMTNLNPGQYRKLFG